MKSLRISLCIVSNHGGTLLEETIASAAPYIEELIILDRSRSPWTFSLSNQYNAKLVLLPQDRSERDVQIEAIRQASCDWMLLLQEGDRLAVTEEWDSFMDDVEAYRTAFIRYRGKLVLTEPDASLVAQSLPVLFHLSSNRMIEDYYVRQLDRMENVDFVSTTECPITIHRTRTLTQLQAQLEHLTEGSAGERSYWQGQIEYYEGNYEEAIASLQIALMELPITSIYSSHAKLRLAQCCLMLQLMEPCLHTIDEALQMDPDYADLHYVRALAYIYEEQYEEAADSLLQAAAAMSMRSYYLSDASLDPHQCYRLAASCYSKLQHMEKMMELMEIVLTEPI
ncbi:tetratricopeptide repeat protein [Paenibacillus sp. 1001270B_150601_E10]|uniref:tetratricopeptide repeat protein n=1 Tax=Paenibacillus sp. 1001270B_150601_E10 TaxID=2787079 RepID=UPI00189E5F57|nr:hypothetical protein [Paenibacillus sp. 1001270B_150601_E10]